MIEVLLVVHLMIALALVIVVLLQRSEGGGLGIGGGGGAGGGFMSARGTANLLTRSTAILAACFFGTSILLAILADTNTRGSIADQVPVSSEPAAPTGPAAPVSE